MGRGDFTLLVLLGVTSGYSISMAIASDAYHQRGMNPDAVAPLGFSIFYSVGASCVFFFYMFIAHLPLWHLHGLDDSLKMLTIWSALFGFGCFKFFRADENAMWRNSLSRPFYRDTVLWMFAGFAPAVSWIYLIWFL